MPARTSAGPAPSRGLAHVTIECVTPELDHGRFPVKRIVGDVVAVGADIFRDGHDLLAAHVVVRPPDAAARTIPMRFDYDSDRWLAEFTVDRIGRWHFTIEAWTDAWATWRAALEKKVAAGQDVGVELRDGDQLIRAAARRAPQGPARAALSQSAKAFESAADDAVVKRALDDELAALMRAHFLPRDLTRHPTELAIVVDRERARFATWYELFPRSTDPSGRHGTFRTATAALDRVQRLGFDVVYLPPIHPIGRTFRKGKNNSLEALPDDVGSPWAIGNADGGHDAVNPDLGTIADFDRFVAAAAERDMEIALDYALQCSPDHPWVTAHPDWYFQRADGTIAYAENPPKKYQDIYPLNFWCADRQALWEACRDVVLHWIAHGVKIFRVDNPHTKPFAFWEWMIADVQSRHPDVIFFSEAFTRPKRMRHLAKLGFTMSYTYFTWKNTAWELRDHMSELHSPPATEYFRGNLFANTPDILHEYLVTGGRPAFRARLVLAATLSPLYGIYSGFELVENTPVREGSEEYLDSEKYELRPRDWAAEGNIAEDVALLNRIRRENPALQRFGNLTFLPSENENILFYRREGARLSALGSRSNDILVVVNLDPKNVQASTVYVPENGTESFEVQDLLTGAHYTWRTGGNYVRLDPREDVAHVLAVQE